MISPSFYPRIGRSHRFGESSYICRFCGRPLQYFNEQGWAYCSASWTGRGPAAVSGHWRLGPLEWTRAGAIYVLRLGFVSLYGIKGKRPVLKFQRVRMVAT